MTPIRIIARSLRPWAFTGPIFDKELRVASRRRRTYVLRFGYLAMLTLLVTLVWLGTVGDIEGSSPEYRISRMSEAGKVIVASIVWFQFLTAQLVALVLMSTSISDEIQHRTLGTLMTTPINSFQIVMGKLFSRMLQLVILLAVSLPLLAVVRVFGGVPWDYILSSVCITLCTAVFFAALSMYFSVFSRRAYSVILRTILTGAALFGLAPTILLAVTMADQLGRSPQRMMDVMGFVLHTNPFFHLGYATAMMVSPSPRGMMFAVNWPLLCAVLLGSSIILLVMCVSVVRRVALRQAVGEDIWAPRRRASRQPAAPQQAGAAPAGPAAGRIRTVTGSPVVWRELRAPHAGRRRVFSVIGPGLLVILLIVGYISIGYVDGLRERGVHVSFIVLFTVLGLLVTAVQAATPITTEKEARSWSILLGTTLSEWQILWGKAVGIWRRCLPIWGLLAGHLIVFTLAGYIHPVVSFHMAFLVAWAVLFFTGTGLYLGARMKRTTAAVIANMVVGLILWVIIPFILAMGSEIAHEHALLWLSVDANPVVQAAVVSEHGCGLSGARTPARQLRYDWPSRGNSYRDHTVNDTTFIMFLNLACYGGVALLLAACARKRLRQGIF